MIADKPQERAGSTSKTLLKRAVAGNEEAWCTIVALYEPLIRAWLGRTHIAPQEADDLTQDVLAKVVKELGKFKRGEREGSFRCWLRTITVNRAR